MSTKGVSRHAAGGCLYPPSSNNNGSEALSGPYQPLSAQQTTHPDAFLLLGENATPGPARTPQDRVSLTTPTQEPSNTGKQHSGQCRHISERTPPTPHPGASDHLTVNARTQTDHWLKSPDQLGSRSGCGCDWGMLKQAAPCSSTTDLQEHTVTITKSITVPANQKPWLTGEGTG